VNLRQNPPENTDIYVKPTTGFSWIGINVDHEPYGDIRVRQAIRKAIDIDQVIQAAYFGLTEPSGGIVAPGLVGYRKRDLPPRDVEGARRLLAEAGLANGFKTTLVTLNNTTDLTVCQVVQANLADIGVEVEIQPVDGGVYWDLGLEEKGNAWKDLQLVHQSWTSSADPRRATMWFVCDQVGEWNWQRWCNEEYSELEAAANVETDLEKRAVLYERMMDIMWASAAFINITHPTRVVLVRSDIEPNMLPNGYVYARFLTAKG
jgi:peptide/nickel transport system substrate-binding protein